MSKEEKTPETKAEEYVETEFVKEMAVEPVEVPDVTYEGELIGWAEEAAQLSREQQRSFLRDAARLLRESYMLHAGLSEVCYLWGEELAFCSKFAPFVGSRNIEPLIAEIESAVAQIAQNGNPTIVFTHFALSVSKMIKHL